MRYHLSKYLKTEPTSKEYRSLERTAELLDGERDLLVYLCQMLWQANQLKEAKGIMRAYQLTGLDFS